MGHANGSLLEGGLKALLGAQILVLPGAFGSRRIGRPLWDRLIWLVGHGAFLLPSRRGGW